MARPRSDSIDVATPERVLVAARQVFGDHGFERARLADIARLAGIRRPSLLYHFPTKEVLYAAVVERTFARLGAMLADAMNAGGGFEARLEGMARGVASAFAEEPADARLVVRELMEPESLGRRILLAEVVPLLDGVVTWIGDHGGSTLRPGLQLRGVVMQIVSDVLLQNVAGELRDPLWGAVDADRTWATARALLLG
ncbi:MAG: TetR/AcrR family transcriptional regulator [Alphaproteobacteria bacterium]|nr:TetR/AcrR family transcriptional regulator [Alphaproteobacteria bacterium]MCB9698493.1 TetR/AcrR family transcriptional regulator [Alphaproteobacteria bacterium]